MKRSIALVLLLTMIFSLSACSVNEPFSDTGKDEKPKETEPQIKVAEVYKKYDNLVSIGNFVNGLAPFTIHDANGNYHWSYGVGSWTGDYFFGYINSSVDVVIKPKYECSPQEALPAFYYEYICLETEKVTYILDRQGNAKFQTGAGNVSEIGTISQGYFWVETYEEALSGMTYTVQYYNAKNMQVVATFAGMRAVPDNQSVDGKNSTLDSSGNARLVRTLKNYYSSEDILDFNIKDYDGSFAVTPNVWDIDFTAIESFQGASKWQYIPSVQNNDLGYLAAVRLQNSNGTLYYSVIDSEGNVLLEPQQDIAFPGWVHVFCLNLCPAEDVESGLWGYIDPYGNWVIQPQYSSAGRFSEDGYAVINNKIVIDTTGKVVLSPEGWKNEVVTSLSGKYRLKENTSFYLSFSENGNLKGGEYGIEYKGTYTIKGSTLIISDFNKYTFVLTDGNHSFVLEGDALIIDGKEWSKVVE